MTAEDDALFDAAPKEQLLSMLRRRGVFVHSQTPKEDLRLLFGIAFSFREYQELRNKQTTP